MSPRFHRNSLPPAGAGLLCLLSACATPAPPPARSGITIHDLDSLHLEAQYQDSVESNLFFYDEAYSTYRDRFPGVDRKSFMAVARGKDKDFCLFQPDPAANCLDVGNKYNDLGMKEPARDAYEAGLLSEGENESKVNVRLWSSLAQLHFDSEEFTSSRSYLSKVLEVDPRNKWAKRMLGEVAGKPGGG